MFIDRLEVRNNTIVKNTTYFSVGTHTHTHTLSCNVLLLLCLPHPHFTLTSHRNIEGGAVVLNLATKCN